MADALDDFTRLTGALGDFAGSVFQLFDARVQAESAARAMQINKERTDFLVRMALPRGDPRYIGTANWADELNSMENSIQSGFLAIKDPFVKTAVERIYADSGNEFRLNMAQQMGAAARKEGQDMVTMTLAGISSSIGDPRQKLAEGKKYLDSPEAVTLFGDDEYGKLSRDALYDKFSAPIVGEALIADAKAKNPDDMDSAIAHVSSANGTIDGEAVTDDGGLVMASVSKLVEERSANDEALNKNMNNGLAENGYLRAMDYNSAMVAIASMPEYRGASQGAKVAAVSRLNVVYDLDLEKSAISVVESVMAASPRITEAQYRNGVAQLDSIAKYVKTEKGQEAIQVQREKLKVAYEEPDKADLTNAFYTKIGNLKEALRNKSMSAAEVYAQVLPNTTLSMMAPGEAETFRQWIIDSKFITDNERLVLDGVLNKAYTNALVIAGVEAGAKAGISGASAVASSFKSASKSGKPDALATAIQNRITRAVLNEIAAKKRTSQEDLEKVAIEAALEAAQIQSFGGPINVKYTFGSGSKEAEAKVAEWNAIVEAGPGKRGTENGLDRTMGRDAYGRAIELSTFTEMFRLEEEVSKGKMAESIGSELATKVGLTKDTDLLDLIPARDRGDLSYTINGYTISPSTVKDAKGNPTKSIEMVVYDRDGKRLGALGKPAAAPAPEKRKASTETAQPVSTDMRFDSTKYEMTTDPEWVKDKNSGAQYRFDSKKKKWYDESGNEYSNLR